MISAKMMALSGATSDGFSTIVQPAANAGATLHAIWLMGQFQGVISPQTPIGSRTMRLSPMAVSNSRLARTSRVTMKWPSPAVAWARCASQSGAPDLGTDDLAEIVETGGPDLDDAVQQREPLFASGEGVGLEGRLGRCDRSVDVVGATHGDRLDGFLGRRVDHGEGLCGERSHPLPADVELLGVVHGVPLLPG